MLDEPFIAEDPDYDLQVFQGEPLKHDYNPPVPSMTYRGNVNGEENGISRPSMTRRPPSRPSRSPPANS